MINYLAEDGSQNLCDGRLLITCDLCNYSSEAETDFKTHFELEHEQKNDQMYSCSKCTVKADSIPKLIKHLKSHYKCFYCKMTFEGGKNSLRDFKRHMRRTHQNPKLANSDGYPCLHCHKIFPVLTRLRRHMQICSVKTGKIRVQIDKDVLDSIIQENQNVEPSTSDDPGGDYQIESEDIIENSDC